MSGLPLARVLPVASLDNPADRLSALFDAHHDRLYRLARRPAASRDDALEGFVRPRRQTCRDLIDGEVVTAPVLTGSISASALISGDYTRAEADRIVRGIRVR
jgi:hypothetical protein